MNRARAPGPMATAVLEALDAVAAPGVRDMIVRLALRFDQNAAIPERGPSIRAFVEDSLYRAVSELLGEEAAQHVREHLLPIATMAAGDDVSDIRPAPGDAFFDEISLPMEAPVDDRSGPEGRTVGLDGYWAPEPRAPVESEPEALGVWGERASARPAALDRTEPGPVAIAGRDLDPTLLEGLPGLEAVDDLPEIFLDDELDLEGGPELVLDGEGEDLAAGGGDPPGRDDHVGLVAFDDLVTPVSGALALEPGGSLEERRLGRTDPAPRGELPFLLVASTDPTGVQALSMALSGLATLEPVRDSLVLLELAARGAALVVDAGAPSIRPETLVALDPELPEGFPVVVWGQESALRQRLGLAGQAPPPHWVLAGHSARDVVSVCRRLLGA